MFMTSHAFSNGCETSLDHIHSENQMAIECLLKFGHRITEVTDLAVKDFDFQTIEQAACLLKNVGLDLNDRKS